MTQHIRFALSFAAACSTAAVLSAQTPSQPQTPPRPTSPTTQQPTTKSDTMGMTTISGCLKLEKDIAGMKPNVAERAGMGEDYILTNVKMGAASAGTVAGSGTTGTTGSGTAATGAAGASAGRAVAGLMYKIEGLDDAELKKHLNHHIELQGKVDDSAMGSSPSGSPSTSGTSGAAAGAAPKEFNATSLKMISATCPSGT